MPLNTCLFNTTSSSSHSNPNCPQYLPYLSSIQSFHHIIYSFLGSVNVPLNYYLSKQPQNISNNDLIRFISSQRTPLSLDSSVQDQMNCLIPSKERIEFFLSRNNDQHKMSQLFNSILMMKLSQELESYIITHIGHICNSKSTHISNTLYSQVFNLLELLEQTQIQGLFNSLQQLYSARLSKSFILGEKLFSLYSNNTKSLLFESPSSSADEEEFHLTKKEELSEDLNEAASTTSGYSREGDICLWSLTTLTGPGELDKPAAHDAYGNYLFTATAAEDDNSMNLQGVWGCYDGFFVGNLEMTFDTCDQYLSLPMKQIPGRGNSQKQTPKEIVVEKKPIGQIKTHNMFSSPVIQNKTRFDYKDCRESYSNPATPQYLPQKYQRRSPKSNFQKTYGQSLEKKPQQIEGVSMSTFVNEKASHYGQKRSGFDHHNIHTRLRNHLTDSQPNSGFAKRS